MKKILFLLGVLLAMAGRTLADNLSAETVLMETGGTKEIAIVLDNPTKQYVAFQLDVVLPDGITLATNDKGNPAVSLDADRADGHTLNVKDIGDNTYRILSFSMPTAAFAGTSGALLHLTLKTAADAKAGAKTVTITGQTFTDADANQVKWNDVSFTVNVLTPVTIKADDQTRSYGDANPEWSYSVTGGDIFGSGKPVLNCEATVTSPVGKYDITYVKGTLRIRSLVAEPGDLNDDGDIDVTDVVELIDMVLAGIYDPAGDINGDGEVDVTDVVELIDMVLSGD